MLGSRFDLAETIAGLALRGSAAEGLLAGAAVATPADPLVDHPADLDDRCVELEFAMAEVARHVHAINPRTSFSCPVCATRMEVSGERVLAEFGELDVRRHDLACDTCGLTTLRAFHPSIGYSELPR